MMDLPALARPLIVAALAAVAGCTEEAPPGDAIQVPSGRDLRLIEIITNAPGPEGATARFRFLAPGLTEADIPTSADDMQALCDSFALSRIEGMVPQPQQIVISLAGEEVPFGEAAPDVVQFFEAYRVEDGLCVWSPF